MRFRLAALLTCLSLCLINPQVSHADGGSYVQLNYPDGRLAELYVPANLAPDPQLWVVLHGANQSLQQIESYGFRELADQWGFLVVYPQGVDSVWNAGTCCYSQTPGWPDDVAFLNGVVADIQSRYPGIVPGIKAVGFSNGGMMAYTWACQQPEVNGASAVAGAWTSTAGCDRSPLRVHSVHSYDDPVVPYFGGYSAITGTTFQPQRSIPTDFPAGSHVSLDSVVKGGHSWPPGAAQEIWDALH